MTKKKKLTIEPNRQISTKHCIKEGTIKKEGTIMYQKKKVLYN
jgi:hypothetical protein